MASIRVWHQIEFSFKVECPSEFDCAPKRICPPVPRPQPEINYLARDYASFRQLILDRMALLLPEWRERNPADLGITLVELLAYVGDHLSYQQDAIATEAYLGSARKRTSLRRHARLVDYFIHDGSNARVWVQLTTGADGVLVPKRTQILGRLQRIPMRIPPASNALDDALRQRPIVFETLHEITLFEAHNRMRFYTWSDRECCLPRGATRATLDGHFPRLVQGEALIFEEFRGSLTGGEEDADRARRCALRLTMVRAFDENNQRLIDPLTDSEITEIEWMIEDALPFPFCLSGFTDEKHGAEYFNDLSVARGNIVLADHGQTIAGEPIGVVPETGILLPPDPDEDRCHRPPQRFARPRFRPALKRRPLTQSSAYDAGLPARASLAVSVAGAMPEIELEGRLGADTDAWHPQRDLLASAPDKPEFVVEVETDGTAFLRFGDDEHGQQPEPETGFTATYRVGNGSAGNVGAETLAHIVINDPAITGVRNPLPAAGGIDPETMEEIRRDAPEAFRTQRRAVTEADYARTAERDPRVQRAAATLRWTGSWHTVFITIDPFRRRVEAVNPPASLRNLIEPFRMAGHDLEIDTPRYVPIEIAMFVCVKPDYFRSDVGAALLEVFNNGILADGRMGVFHPDRLHLRPNRLSQPALCGGAGRRGRGLCADHGVSASGPAGDERTRRWLSCHESPRDRAPRQRSELRGARSFQTESRRRKMMSAGLNDCGCCEGITAVVPRPLENRPGLSSVRYRIGTHGDFFAAALAALSDPNFAALRALTTRERNDFTLALLDGWAMLADVLTFYQERIANELWLRTAIERDSILRLAHLIGYRLRPGVAAESPLSFVLDETPGAPEQVTVEIGTKVQSVPGSNEKPQTFETTEPLDARVEWNALTPAVTTPPMIATGVTSLYLEGTATNLQPGDAILIVGDERDQPGASFPDSERWDVRVLLTVSPDVKNARTHITWEKGLGKERIQPAAANVKVYAFRQRAALFGHNAPDPKLITGPGGIPVGTWTNFGITGNHIDLDSAYPRIVPGSWVVLVNDAGFAELYKADAVSHPSRADFALSGKVTRIVPDTTAHLSSFDLRETLVFAQSEQLDLANGPLISPQPGSLAAALNREAALLAPVEGSMISLSRRVPALEAGRKVIVTGKPLRVRVTAASLALTSADGLQTTTVMRGRSLVLTARPTLLATKQVKWSVRTDEGFEGMVTTDRNDLILTAAREEDVSVSQLAVIDQCLGDPSVLTLNSLLTHLFDRATVAIAANVADSTHGETVAEMLGSGDASQADQRFVLKQSPLTFVRSAAAGGAESKLRIRVNDLLWREVSTLFERGPLERIFTTTLADDGTVAVRFGDGVHGARLPSGQNVTANYRRGIGLEGLVRERQLSTLLTRPPGLKSAINPLAADGADEAESLADARQNAPLTVLTLDRVVSLEDYENFSRDYAGVSKSLATWTWDGRTRGIFLTVAGPRGAAVSTTLAHDLVNAIHGAGDRYVPVRVESYGEARFRLSGRIAIHPDYRPDVVRSSVIEALRGAFSFERRRFGQPVMLSEVIAVAQSIAGVVAVTIRKFHRSGAVAKLNPRLEAALPIGGDPAALAAAELLTIDPAPIDIEVMP